MLMVSPMAPSRMIDTKMESGMEMEMTIVGRQSPRKTRIITAVSAAAIRASRSTPMIEARTNRDWSNREVIFSSGGSAWAACATMPLIPATICRVEALPFL